MQFHPIRTAVALTLLLTLPTHAADPLPTMDELQSLQAKKDWPALLGAVSRVLPVKGPATAAYDRTELWMMKGEAQLQSNQFVPASQSFANAAEEKTAPPEKADYALAMAELAKRSDAKGYKTPARQGPPQAFDIRDPAKRPEALAAMLNANHVDLTQRVKQVKVATESKPLVELAKNIAQSRPLDRVVNQSVAKTDALETELAQNFIDSVTKWSTAADEQLAEILARADEMVELRTQDAATGRVTVSQHRRGVQQADQGAIKKVMQQAEQLATTYGAVQKAMSQTGQAAIKPGEALVQGTYNRAKTLEIDRLRVTTPDINGTGTTGTPGTRRPRQ
ncbi:MAG TPA: hypothetical protein VF595_12725 [Tepidisphaeraceae bacterium]|jgi:hypothetical protein